MDVQVENQIHSISAAMSQAMLDEMPHETNPLISRDSQKQKIAYEMESELRSFATRIADGLKEIDRMADKLAIYEPKIFTPEVVLALKKLCQGKTDLQQAAIRSLFEKDQKQPIRELVGIDQAVVKALYRSGAELYNSKSFNEASAAFTVVTLMEVPAYDAWIGLGNSEFYCQRYQSALIAYAMAAWSNPKNPMPHIYSSHCYEALKQYENALNSLDIAQQVIKNNPVYSAWGKQTEELKNRLEKLVGG
ncbi:MAG: hypothetical protein LLG04_07400 [Parachlamydia sp.]|nr:hypothetical protein [Parachlamydia sp.]